ncbi:MAG: YjbQ family protein [Candidatus Riflebacteria bacterium]|nr:YjbQ family protein [Candidatus Riflebacteria bacterium]
MPVYSASIPVKTRGDCHIVDLTRPLQERVLASGIKTGIALVFVPGSTAGITTIEFEPGLLEDLPELFERLAPSDARYHHDDTWHDGNGHSHVRAALLGPSLALPVDDGRPALGTWQQVVLVDFDNRARSRDVLVRVVGE